MKLIIILSVCIVASLADTYKLPKDPYTEETIKNDDEELKKRLDCYLDKGPCSEISQAYKDIGIDAMATKCEKCSPEVKKALKGFIAILSAKSPETLTEIRAKYDPDGTKYQPFVDAINS